MTEDEFLDMVDAGDCFWEEFSALCWEYIDNAPEHLRGEYRAYLGDKTSIYGIKRETRS